jgi:hypothetical protein
LPRAQLKKEADLNTAQLRAALRDAKVVRCQGIGEKRRPRARPGEALSAEETRRQREEAQAARQNSLWFIDLETVMRMLNFRIITMFRHAGDTRVKEEDIKYGGRGSSARRRRRRRAGLSLCSLR